MTTAIAAIMIVYLLGSLLLGRRIGDPDPDERRPERAQYQYHPMGPEYQRLNGCEEYDDADDSTREHR